jgi:hypothetical protein
MNNPTQMRNCWVMNIYIDGYNLDISRVVVADVSKKPAGSIIIIM